MAQHEQPMQTLSDFLPANSYDRVADYLHRYKVHLTITKARASVLGDYRNAHQSKNHRISVNGNLNKFSFLITLLHELAHLLTFEKHKHTVAAHGAEWKGVYGGLLSAFIEHTIFPADIKKALAKSLQNPAASSCAEEDLMRVLRRYDAPKEGVYLLEQLSENTVFVTPDGRQFIKGNKLRKRYRCKEVATGQLYLFSPVYEVKPVGSIM